MDNKDSNDSKNNKDNKIKENNTIIITKKTVLKPLSPSSNTRKAEYMKASGRY